MVKRQKRREERCKQKWIFQKEKQKKIMKRRRDKKKKDIKNYSITGKKKKIFL